MYIGAANLTHERIFGHNRGFVSSPPWVDSVMMIVRKVDHLSVKVVTRSWNIVVDFDSMMTRSAVLESYKLTKVSMSMSMILKRNICYSTSP